MSESTMPDDLAALVAELGQRLAPGPGDLPPTLAQSGLDQAQWRDQVAIVRARHDSSALELDALLRQHAPLDPVPGVRNEWAQIEVEGGRIGLRLYRPEPATSGTEDTLPVVVLVHGGGYWMGGGAAGWQLNDRLCRAISGGVGALVVSVDHRLAPEHGFPVPVDDVAAAITWVHDHASELGADAGRIALHGTSSGGNLVAVCAHRSCDGLLPPIRGMVLQVPSVNLGIDSGRFQASPIEVAGARQVVALYTGGADTSDPQISPGLRPDLTGTPPTLLVTAQFDALSADTEAFAERLAQAGVPVELASFAMTHTVATSQVAAAVQARTVDWLTQVLNR